MVDHRELGPEARSGHTLLVDIWSELATFKANLEHIMQAQGRADASRRDMHDKLDSFSRTADTVNRLEPIVLLLEQQRLRQDGARRFGDWLGRALWGFIGSAIALAVELAHYARGH